MILKSYLGFASILGILITVFSFCKIPKSSCIDPNKIDKEALCTMQYEPVCGCDNKTYENACFAERAGVVSYTPGACKATP
ncbi:Kazal-type serine protease inhibitor domain-containing protein [Adhaeribacter aquaticus]|uniref:Kazal-type serine protease inhibitor domain-containing protein n=1 Tax=Adhaeribacter aquaticus TaxID=299567 RepID=UPI00054E403F|nr:Kazal-type serine protease inhibitor domain-containing protein [Adhaeribacter aquaticus]